MPLYPGDVPTLYLVRLHKDIISNIRLYAWLERLGVDFMVCEGWILADKAEIRRKG